MRTLHPAPAWPSLALASLAGLGCPPAGTASSSSSSSGSGSSGLSSSSLATSSQSTSTSLAGPSSWGHGGSTSASAAPPPSSAHGATSSSAGGCDGVTCSGHGACVVRDGHPSCDCEDGYHADNLRCVPHAGPCAWVDCSGHGQCAEAGGAPACTCDQGFHPVALECLPTRTSCLVRDMSQPGDTFAFPTRDGVPASTLAESECVRLVNLPEPLSLQMHAYSDGEIRVNQGTWTTGPIAVAGGDEVRVRLLSGAAADDAQEMILVDTAHGDGLVGGFLVRTANSDRPPQLFQVGPGRPHRELAQVAPLLRAGDVVQLDGDATYAPVTFSRSGLAEAPIVIRGTRVNGRRPVVSGGEYTLRFNEANHYRLEDLEVTGGSQVCVRAQSDGLRVVRSRVHHCPRHAVLGADSRSGTLVLDRTEVSDSGGELPGENLKHAVYVATDRDAYPGSKLKVVHSHIHGFRGNGIKSRAERAEVYFNWIEGTADADSYYSVQLVGFQEYRTLQGLEGDVVGNVLVHRSASALSLGGDGSGESRGRVRLVHNTVLLHEGFTPWGPPVIRVAYGFQSLFLANNVFLKVAATDQALRLWRHDSADWVTGQPLCSGHNNWIPSGGQEDADYTCTGLVNSLRGTANPGLQDVSSIDNLDVTVLPGSVLAGGASPETVGGPGYQVDNPLTALGAVVTAQRPSPGAERVPEARTGGGPFNIGAR